MILLLSLIVEFLMFVFVIMCEKSYFKVNLLDLVLDWEDECMKMGMLKCLQILYFGIVTKRKRLKKESQFSRRIRKIRVCVLGEK